LSLFFLNLILIFFSLPFPYPSLPSSISILEQIPKFFVIDFFIDYFISARFIDFDHDKCLFQDVFVAEVVVQGVVYEVHHFLDLLLVLLSQDVGLSFALDVGVDLVSGRTQTRV